MPQQWKKEKREKDGNEKADELAGHGVADVVEREVSRSGTFTPPAYSEERKSESRSPKSRSASEPPKRKRGEAVQSEEGGKAAQMLHYQSRLAKLREEELDLENTQRIEEAKLEILSKQRRNKQLQQKIKKTKKTLVEMENEGIQSASRVAAKAQLKPQSASSRDRWAQSASYAEEQEQEQEREIEVKKEKRGQMTVQSLERKRDYMRMKQEREQEEWGEEWAKELTDEEEEKWFARQLVLIKGRCTFCKQGNRKGKQQCWMHNWHQCKFCAMGPGHCEKHDEFGRWRPDIAEVMSGRWEARLEREARREEEKKEEEAREVEERGEYGEEDKKSVAGVWVWRPKEEWEW